MVERALSMGEVEGSMPSFSTIITHIPIEPFCSLCCSTTACLRRGAAETRFWHLIPLFSQLLITATMPGEYQPLG